MSSAGDPVRRTSQSAPEPLPAAELRWRCPPQQASERSRTVTDLLGQRRPLEALSTGLELRAPGYHVFVSGLMGTGRTALVKSMLEELRPLGEPGPDRIYLNNFREPHSPRLLTLPRGAGSAFQRDMEDLVLCLQDALQASLSSRPHKMSRRLVIRNAEARQRRLMDALARLAEQHDCALVQFETQGGVMAADIYPVWKNEPQSPQTLGVLAVEGELTTVERDDLLARRESLLERLEEVSDRARRASRRTDLELRRMDQHVAAQIVESHFRVFCRQWPQPEVGDYLGTVRDCITRDLERWIVAAGEEERRSPTAAGVEAPGAEPSDDPGRGGDTGPRLANTHLHELAVHVVHTGDPGGGGPVVVETIPTYANLFGTIEPPREGAPHGGLSLIHPGALLRADGGYLVLRAADVLSEPGVWAQLKRALKAEKLEIREYDPGSGTTVGTLQPEAIPFDIKVVLIGEPGVYEQLAADDPQFLHTFKVHAEFDTTVPATADNLQRYADFLAFLSREHGLREFSPDAAAAVAEQGARRAGRRDRLTTRFSEIADLAREASHGCARNGPGPVQREHVREAYQAMQRRLDLSRELIERDLHDGYLLVRTSGRSVGQVNSLTVMDTGTFAFGKPCRITASTGSGPSGRSRLVNIEREADLSGPLHDKGVMILHGFLLDRFAQDGTLRLEATLCFEQNYGGIDGDSASSAELYALISSLAKVPLAQGIGVTGSVNQKGEIQAVSAVNEKIEGFFRLCRAQGFVGGQGALIPRANVPDLMLDEEIVEAVRAGQFSVWAIDRVDEGLRILCGMSPDEVMGRAATTLALFREQAR